MRGIEPLIRECGPKEAYDPNCQHLVVIDTSTGRPPSGTLTDGFLGDVLGRRRHLLVSDVRHPHGVWTRKGLVFPIVNLGRSMPVNLILDYSLRCRMDGAERLARAIWTFDDGAAALDHMVKRWVQEWIVWCGGEAVLIEVFFTEKDKLREHLEKRAEEDLGLNLEVTLLLDDGGASASVELRRRQLSVRLRDDPRERRIVVDARIDPVPASARTALPLPGAEIEATVVSTIAEVFTQQVTTEAYFGDLSTTVSADLLRHLQATLHPSGWQVGTFHIEGAAPSSLLDPIHVDIDFTATVADDDQPVRLTGQAILRRSSIAAHERAGAPDMAVWVKGELARLAREMFSSRLLADLYERFDGLRAALKIELNRAASARGHTVEQLTLTTDLRLDRPFSIELSIKDVPTKRAGVKVGLCIVVTGQFKNHSKAMRLLGRGTDVEQSLRTKVTSVVRHAMCEVEPEDFYVYFDAPRAMHPSVQHLLSEAIRAALVEPMGAELGQITCNRLQTDVTDWIHDLVKPSHDVRVVVTPSGGHEPITYKGVFDVKGVRMDGWETAIQRRPRAEDLTTAVQQSIGAHFDRIDVQWLMFAQPEEMLVVIHQILGPHIGERFGLTVKMASWRREPTSAELAAVTVRKAYYHAQAGAQVSLINDHVTVQVAKLGTTRDAVEHRRKELEELRKRYLTEVASDSELASALRIQIEVVEKELRDLAGTAPPAPFDLGAMPAPLAFPQPAPKPQLGPPPTPATVESPQPPEPAAPTPAEAAPARIEDLPSPASPWWTRVRPNPEA